MTVTAHVHVVQESLLSDTVSPSFTDFPSNWQPIRNASISTALTSKIIKIKIYVCDIIGKASGALWLLRSSIWKTGMQYFHTKIAKTDSDYYGIMQ